ncbi:MAG: hypothetical protein J0H42_20950 [Rhizobiales bacterium]|nr:hypothetical protein [Hyphomicrobiales bacterium]
MPAAAGMATSPDVAAAALRELRRAQPNVSIAWVRGRVPIQDPAELEDYLEGLRRAGLDQSLFRSLQPYISTT